MKNIDFNNKRIVIRADGSRLIGMGHLVRQATIAEFLIKCGAEVIFCIRDFKEGVLFLQKKNLVVKTMSIAVKKNPDIIINLEPDIVIHDFLETDIAYMEKLKKELPKCFFVGFDDLGEGGVLHHVLFDANRVPVEKEVVWDKNNLQAKRFFGANYIILREEITQVAATDKKIKVEAKDALVLFGGSDPAGLTLKLVMDWIKDMPDIIFRVVLGPGMRDKHIVETHLVDNVVFYENIDAVQMANLMKDADLAIASGGISMFELACVGVPSIVLAQNKAEIVNMHLFAEKQIIIDMGLGLDVEKNTVVATILATAANFTLRKQMSYSGKKYVDGQGLIRIVEVLADCDRYMQL